MWMLHHNLIRRNLLSTYQRHIKPLSCGPVWARGYRSLLWQSLISSHTPTCAAELTQYRCAGICKYRSSWVADSRQLRDKFFPLTVWTQNLLSLVLMWWRRSWKDESISIVSFILVCKPEIPDALDGASSLFTWLCYDRANKVALAAHTQRPPSAASCSSKQSHKIVVDKHTHTISSGAL